MILDILEVLLEVASLVKFGRKNIRDENQVLLPRKTLKYFLKVVEVTK